NAVAKQPKNALYRNDGGIRFTDVTEQAGVGDTGYGLGVTVGDYDNDGDPDLYLNNFGPNILYRNNGDGTFTDVTEQAGVADGDQVGAGTNFLDIDGDGDLDLFVSRYLIFSYDMEAAQTALTGYRVQSGPQSYPRVGNSLYRNNSDGTFTDVSHASGIRSHEGHGMGSICLDFDNDGDTDICVANDQCPNFLFQNDGTGRFEEVGLESGLAYDINGNTQASMGIGCGDFDHDGWLDLYMTSYELELATLYQNTGDGFFDDVTRLTRAGVGTLERVTWGCDFVDFDHDGNKDLFIACGRIENYIKESDHSMSYDEPNTLLMNTGDGQFVDVSADCGDGLDVNLCSRGAAFDDLDNDGDIDVVILNWRQPPTILRNDTVSDNHWIRIRLRGTKTNRDGVGAHVKVVAGDLSQVAEVHSGRGYQSHYGMDPHFGLGKHDRIDRIEVRWIGGGVDVLENLPVDRLITITEGSSSPTQ
ncbi:MAG TPA: CRTAC1 family protein, partial [Thermoguttaceae bacterium]|nr:CRTAC1 family protein [Thermoguttaceae bacterium]